MDVTDCQERDVEVIKQCITSYQDFPKPGIIFRDIFPLFRDAKMFNTLIALMTATIRRQAPDANLITAAESRGFLFGPVIALKMGLPFFPVRKPGKLPGHIVSTEYDLEYGKDTLQMPADAVQNDSRVVVIDDVLATAGTMKAICKMVSDLGGCVVLCLTVVELLELKGKDKLDVPFTSIVQF